MGRCGRTGGCFVVEVTTVGAAVTVVVTSATDVLKTGTLVIVIDVGTIPLVAVVLGCVSDNVTPDGEAVEGSVGADDEDVDTDVVVSGCEPAEIVEGIDSGDCGSDVFESVETVKGVDSAGCDTDVVDSYVEPAETVDGVDSSDCDTDVFESVETVEGADSGD
jgi:hypothetical protein